MGTVPPGDEAEANRRVVGWASLRDVHRAFGWMHLQEPRILAWQMEFLSISAPTFAEERRAHWFCDRFRELGLEDVHLDQAGNAVGVLWPAATDDASPARPSHGPMVLLSAHLDTVFGPEVDTTPSDDEGRIRGPGASDNGAGLAALLAIAASLQHAGLRAAVPVVFAANTGEEGEGDLRGIRHLFEESRFAGRLATAIALEGSGTGLIVDRALGSRRLRVTVRGPGGHSWTDAGRPNPILALAEALIAVGRLETPRQPRTTLTCGTISGGTSVNSLPAQAAATLDMRSASADELDRLEWTAVRTLQSSLLAVQQRQPEDEPLTWQVERIGNRPAGMLEPEEPLYRSLRAVDRHLRIVTEPRIGSTDANWPLSRGIPALAIGCGGLGGGVHTADEWYQPAGRSLALRRILLLLLDTASLLAKPLH